MQVYQQIKMAVMGPPDMGIPPYDMLRIFVEDQGY